MANKATVDLIKSLIEDIFENTEGKVGGDLLQARLLDIVQSRGLFETFQSGKAYQQNEHISFTDNQIYKCSQNTDAGESPTTHPAKWQVIGSVSSITAAIVQYTNFGYTNVEQALDNHENIINGLIPNPPEGVGGRDLVMAGLYQAKEAGSGSVHECTNDVTPDGLMDAAYDASTGTLSAEVDSAVDGSKVLTTGDDSGVYDSLVIENERDPNEGGVGAGIFKVLDGIVRAKASLSYGQHTYRLIHSITGASALLSFYVDNPGTSVISNIQIILPANATKYVSGVPSLKFNDNINANLTISNAVGKHYNQIRVARLWSDETTEDVVEPPVTPPAENGDINVTGVIAISDGVYIENITIKSLGINSADIEGTQLDTVSNVRADDVSDELGRLTAGSGDYPTTGYGGVFISSNSLKTVYTEELQMLNGLYQIPTGNYGSVQPTPGENYNNGMGGLPRRCIPKNCEFTLNNAVGFTIEINDPDGFDAIEQTSLYLQVKVAGVTGWLDANKGTGFVENPINDGDPCLSLFNSSPTEKRVSFGDVPVSGICYVRIGVPYNDSKKFSGLTIKDIV